ncbi:histidine--tRNA ligase [Fructobacillus sp. M1-13]|uniref:Histidine--tRNA ligase n=1 Tax=Fructobacillus papyriferae TaxID=2713171 RepID=A0ABS5QNM8_9LACO|nr:histidine--tRNA ligase [Fructobacillus papyriferae]MBS9334631.1 histidine--tRNA ligase [Fructobacillus papyriferae]MCD2158621.1 histidine--tRNA ligase [Fructobacillus papyriferae]
MAKATFQKPKGTADLFGQNVLAWQKIEQQARLIFSRYGYGEIRTPIFESFDLFSRSAGDTSDVVTKEMYDFTDKGDRHMALRPEGTAGVVRAFVENKLFGPEQEKPYKAFYMGPMFRYERPQAGRFRQFHQIGVEAFGSTAPSLDAEVITMVVKFLSSLGLKDLRVALNTLGDQDSRAAYRQALIDYLKPHEADLSEDSRTRLEKNPLRVLDSKDPKDQAIVEGAPTIFDYLSEASKAHFEAVKGFLDDLKIDYTIDSSMVRGLDYYNNTIFEVMTTDPELKGAATIAGGGRYSGLVEEFGGPETPGIGFGIGVERLIALLEAQGQLNLETSGLDFYLAHIGEASSAMTLELATNLRDRGFSVDLDFADRSVKAQFKTANRRKARFVITIGDAEVESKQVKVKDMVSGKQADLDLTQLDNKIDDVMAELVAEEAE